jgi:hypothetical protein
MGQENMKHIRQSHILGMSLRRCGLVAVLCVTLVAAACDDRNRPTAGPAIEGTPTPAVKQARWRFRTHPSAALGRLTNREKRRIRAQKPRLERLVRDVYNGLFLPTEAKQKVIRERFTARAAAALLRSGAGTPDRLSEVKTTLRRARIGIGAASARQAAAEVWLQARALAGSRKVRIVHRSTLWLQKTRGRWKAIAFEVKQEPSA